MTWSPQTRPEILDARLQGIFKALRLPTVAQHYQSMARQAVEQEHPYPYYLLSLLEQELSEREVSLLQKPPMIRMNTNFCLDKFVKSVKFVVLSVQSEVNRRKRLLSQAKFPIPYTLDTYDFSLVPSLNKHKVLDLARGEFIRQHQNAVLVGQIGTGKTHVATALGYAACELGFRVRFFTAAQLINDLIEAQEEQRLSRLEQSLMKQHLIIIDELGFVPFSQQGAQMLFNFIAQRYQRGSVLLTTNLPFTDWIQVFHQERLLGALLDRLTHHCHILEFAGESVRFRQSQSLQAKTETQTDA